MGCRFKSYWAHHFTAFVLNLTVLIGSNGTHQRKSNNVQKHLEALVDGLVR